MCVGGVMKRPVMKRSIVIDGHKTSVSLEDGFWEALRDIADEHRETLSQLIGRINAGRTSNNLSSSIRLFVLGCYRDPLDSQKPVDVALSEASSPK